MTQKEEIINLMDFLDDQLDEREMQLLLSYFYAMTIGNFNGYSREDMKEILDLMSDWREVISKWLSYRRDADNPFVLSFPVEEGGK